MSASFDPDVLKCDREIQPPRSTLERKPSTQRSSSLPIFSGIYLHKIGMEGTHIMRDSNNEKNAAECVLSTRTMIVSDVHVQLQGLHDDLFAHLQQILEANQRVA